MILNIWLNYIAYVLHSKILCQNLMIGIGKEVVLCQINIFCPLLTPITKSKFFSGLQRFTQIVLKFKTQILQVLQVLNFRTISVNLRESDKNQSSYLGLIGDKIC